MPFVAAAPPLPLRVAGPVAAIAIDAQRRRVFAAGARSIAVIDADTGKLLATIRLGGARSIALEPLGGHVFAGTRDGRIAEIDPDRGEIVRESASTGRAVDTLLYDAVTGKLYADGGGGAAIGVLNARTLESAGSIAFPGSLPGAMTADPVTREVYVAGSVPEISILNAQKTAVRMKFATPGLPGNAIVKFDEALGQVIVVGSNGMLDIYDRAGSQLARATVPANITACDNDSVSHVVACVGDAGVSFVALRPNAAPVSNGTLPLKAPAFASVDAKTHDVLALRSNPDGTGTDFERFHAGDGRDTHPIP